MTDFVPPTDTRPTDRRWAPLAWPPALSVTLTGPGVELFQVVPGRDSASLFAALDHDADWAHVAGRPSDPADFAVRIKQRIESGFLPWAVRLTAPVRDLAVGEVVGMSSYLEVAPADGRLEIGWTAYTPAVWRTGVNWATKLALLTYAFEELGAGRVQFKTDVRNHRSQRAIAGIGATYEGLLRRYQRRSDDTIRDTALFSIVAEEWPNVRDRLRGRLA